MADQQTAENEEERRTPLDVARTLLSSLWFPAFFFAGFLVCYLLPFHDPQPHHVEIAVAGPSAEQLQEKLDARSPGAFDLTQVADADAARQAVTDREAVAGYVPGQGATHQLFVAKAAGYSLENVVQQTFGAVADGSGAQLETHDLAPVAAGDGMGTGMFYLVLACTIPAYVAVMMLLRVTTFGRRDKILTLVGVGAVISCVAYLVGAGLDVIPGNPLTLLFLFLMTQAVAQTSYALVPFCKQFFPAVAVGLFVLLSMPSSGGAIPVEMVPGFFRALHPVMPMGNLIEAMRGTLYFDGVGVRPHVLVLCAWIAAAVVLQVLAVWRERRARRRAAAETAVEPPVEDPTFELQQPSALPPRAARLGQGEPMLKGCVTGADGAPLAGVAITVTGTHGRELVRAVTDEQGEYAATGLQDCFVNVIASAPDRLAAVVRVQVKEGWPVRQDFCLAPRREPGAAVG